MKKIILFVVVITAIAVSVFAQTHKQYEKIRDRIKDELNVDEVKADSAANIVQRYLANTKTIRLNTTLSDDAKKTALKNERKQQIVNLKVFLTDQQIKKLQTLFKNYKSKKQQNQEKADTSLKKYYF